MKTAMTMTKMKMTTRTNPAATARPRSAAVAPPEAAVQGPALAPRPPIDGRFIGPWKTAHPLAYRAEHANSPPHRMSYPLPSTCIHSTFHSDLWRKRAGGRYEWRSSPRGADRDETTAYVVGLRGRRQGGNETETAVAVKAPLSTGQSLCGRRQGCGRAPLSTAHRLCGRRQGLWDRKGPVVDGPGPVQSTASAVGSEGPRCRRCGQRRGLWDRMGPVVDGPGPVRSTAGAVCRDEPRSSSRRLSQQPRLSAVYNEGSQRQRSCAPAPLSTTRISQQPRLYAVDDEGSSGRRDHGPEEASRAHAYKRGCCEILVVDSARTRSLRDPSLYTCVQTRS